jgi:hypothetical protein
MTRSTSTVPEIANALGINQRIVMRYLAEGDT